MSDFQLRNSKLIGGGREPYFVAELNSSHNGNIETAKEMIIQAKRAGCDCVKFQSWSAETLYSTDYYNDNPIAKRIVSKFSLSSKELLEMARFCKEQKIDFASTPYSLQEVDFLIEKCEVPYVKIASMDLNNYPYLEYIAKTGIPIVLSTGMGDMYEIDRAVEVIKSAGNKELCLLHCISIYPAETSTIRLNNILGLRERFKDCVIGFSDHSMGDEMAIASVALGAAMIEKHFTLDRSLIGMDNQVAMEPEEIKALVSRCKSVHTGLGGKDRIILTEELEQRKKMRRSIVASRTLKAGTILTLEDMDVKRPGTGYSPENIAYMIGKVLKNDIKCDRIIKENDLLD